MTNTQIDYDRVRELAVSYREDMVRFLRDLIRIGGESCGEEGKSKRIKEEMEKLGFDRAEIDPLGNVLGWMGTGKRLIAFDGHIDTVGIGEISNWKFDPYEGYENETEIGGRGASDQLGGIVSAVYGARMAKDLGLLSDEYQMLVTGTVQEEDCDGMCWLYIIEKSGIRPEFVVSTEPTNMHVYRGHRGRMEIRVDVLGISCHGSAPERGENAIYKMADIIKEVEQLNERLHYDAFLGKGTVTVSQIFYTSPSRCAVADSCAISLDRRLTDGETYLSALKEIEDLPSVKKWGAKVSMYKYDRPSWTGEIYVQDCYFPTWVIPEDAPQTKALVKAYTTLYGAPKVDKWTFSTNGVAIMGRHGIPTIGLGPGKEEQAHAPNEITWKEDLVRCAAIYSVMPTLYMDITREDNA
ncbi:MAG TPA: YgeY family selenium metabolism-linked hydrolase [Bacillota bacterium]|nr:YgeY family selenium metabolism-linked hydrolase [Bacillota bacterium]